VDVLTARNADTEAENAAYAGRKAAKAVLSFFSVLSIKGKLGCKIFMSALRTAATCCQRELKRKFQLQK
jgi:hypothetical protein